MDPITTAILAAVAAGAASGTTDVAKQVLVDAYTALKHKLKKVFGEDSKLIKSVDDLEQTPDSKGYQLVLQEQMTAAKADQYPELVQAAQALLDQLKAQPGGEQHIQTATGNYIAQADRGSRASVKIGEKK